MISVIIPTIDRPRLLVSALRSLARQSYTEFEVVVVNDGGQPLGRVLAPWARRLRLILVELPRRSGPGAARNAALLRASGEYLAFLDDDDVVLPDHLATAHAKLRGTNADFAYSDTLVATRRLTGRFVDARAGSTKSYAYDDRFLYVANYIHTGAVVLRNFSETGARFDEELPVCEDWDMWLRLARGLGMAVIHIPSVTAVYHQMPGAPGLVFGAQSTPDVFGAARRRIETRWRAPDEQVKAYRRWFAEFESLRRRRGESGVPTRDLLFEDALRYLHPRFLRGDDPGYEAIPDLFEGRPEVILSTSEASTALPR